MECDAGYWCKALTYMNYTPEGTVISCEPGKAKACASCNHGKSKYYEEPPPKKIVMSSEQMAHMDDIVLGAVPPPILCPNCKHPVDYEAEHIDGDPEDQSHYWYVCPEPPAKEPKKGVD